MKLIGKAEFIQQQIQETVKQDQDGVTVRMATITCRCGRCRGVMLMYQCLYCKEWFCELCAEQHFGMTVSVWKDKKYEQRKTNTDR